MRKSPTPTHLLTPNAVAPLITNWAQVWLFWRGVRFAAKWPQNCGPEDSKMQSCGHGLEFRQDCLLTRHREMRTRRCKQFHNQVGHLQTLVIGLFFSPAFSNCAAEQLSGPKVSELIKPSPCNKVIVSSNSFLACAVTNETHEIHHCVPQIMN